MAIAVQGLRYQSVTIQSLDGRNKKDLTNSITSIDYYEDIFSPTITAKIIVTNTGDAVQPSDRKGNSDGALQSIYNGLPLRGGERVAL